MTGLGLLRFLSDLRGGAGLDRAVAIAERVMKLDLRRQGPDLLDGHEAEAGPGAGVRRPGRDPDPRRADLGARPLGPGGGARPGRRGPTATGQTVIFSGHVLSEVEQVADRVAIMRRGRLMHVEDMHAPPQACGWSCSGSRATPPETFPEELELDRPRAQRRRRSCWSTAASVGPLLAWLAAQQVADLAIGTEDLAALYDRYHGPNVPDDEEDSP